MINHDDTQLMQELKEINGQLCTVAGGNFQMNNVAIHIKSLRGAFGKRTKGVHED